MQGARMILYDCGQSSDAADLKQRLAECGAEVAHTFNLIPGIVVGLSSDALQNFFTRYPGAIAVSDQQRQPPPLPLRPDELREVSTSADATPARSTEEEPEISPLAVSLMKADEVHALGIDGCGVRVCVVDSGIDFSHPDLAETAARDENGAILEADFTETDLTDTLGHGTAVAGSIAAQARQVYPITDDKTGAITAYTRIKGIAPGVRLMSAKVFDTRVASGWDSSIIAALEWAADHGAQIINLSLGGAEIPNDGSDALAAAVTALSQKGILVTCSAGNSGAGMGSLDSPGSAAGALTVGASTTYRSFAEVGFLTTLDKWTADQMAPFSSLGPTADGRIKPEIVAPGAFDWGLAPMNEAEYGQIIQLFGGTSQSAPLMAGAAALVYQAFFKTRGRYPTPQELIELVCGTADDLGLPPNMQGVGRVNCLKAVQAAMGQAQPVTATLPAPAVVMPGKSSTVTCTLANPGGQAVQVSLRSTSFHLDTQHVKTFGGEIIAAQTTQEFQFAIAAGVDAMQVALDWPSSDISHQSPRLMLALYDPQGRFINYQTPAYSGELELGRSVDAWVTHPETGTWTARIVLRQAASDTRVPFTLSARPFRRSDWDWIRPEAAQVSLQPGETRTASLAVTVPAETPSGVYMGQFHAGSIPLPLSVVVPIALEESAGTFAGSFEHGYQGYTPNGDWMYHDLPVPPDTKSLVAAIQWPDVGNALEFYLVDPERNVVLGRTNASDVLDDGISKAMGAQMILANPMPGSWRMVVRSFAFCGRGMPEPYVGDVAVCGEVLSPKLIQMRVARGSEAPLALFVRNPGRMPVTVRADAQSTDARLLWRNLKAELKSGTSPDGTAEGESQIELATIEVPYGAKQMGVEVTWSTPDVEVVVALYDPVAQSSKSRIADTKGHITMLQANPLPGDWILTAGTVSPGVEVRQVDLKGATFVVAPQPLANVTTQPITIQPGGTGVLPLTLRLPEDVNSLAGRIVVTSTTGDQFGEVPFLLEAEDAGGQAEVATTR